MVSMKDISRKCGVSVATVSKAMNNHSDIGEETKKHIRKVAKEMGYFPNSSARALKTNRTYNLGVLFVDEARSGLTHDYFANVLDSFKVTAEKKGYDITFINCNKENQRMSYLEHSRYRGVDGVVIACVDFGDDEILELIRSDVPVVTIDHIFDNKTSVMSDNVKGIRDLVTFIYRKGHRRIAFIHGTDSTVTQNRVGSFYKTLGDFGIEISDEYVKTGIYRDPVSAAELTREFLDMPEEKRPTCILYPDDFSCIGGINAIKERGLMIPDDISVAGYDGINIAKVLDPQITTLQQDTQTLGRKAAECLISAVEKPKTALIERVVVEGEVLPGGSVKDLI